MPGARRAGAHRDHPLRLEHLVVERRMIGAILIDTRPDRISRSAWRGETRNTSAPKRARSYARGDDRHHLDRAAGEPEPSGKSAFLRAQFERPCRTSSCRTPLLDVLLEVLALEVAAQHVLRLSWRDAEVVRPPCRPRVRVHFHSSAPLRQTNTKRDQQQHDEHDRLAEGERAERLELDGDRVEEDDLDVEQDEQHRDQVEADPEAEAALHVGRQAALVRLALAGSAAARADAS